MAIFGLTFQPGVPQNGGSGNGNGNGAQQRGRVQEPVQILSTRLPKVFGAAALAPAELLRGAGGMGQPAARGNVVAQAIAQLAGLPPSMTPVPPAASASQLMPQSAAAWDRWIGPARFEPGQPAASQASRPSATAPASFIYSPPTPAPQPPPRPPMPHIGFKEPPGVPGTQPGPSLPGPFLPPIFPTPPQASGFQPRPDVQSIQAIADALFRKFPHGF